MARTPYGLSEYAQIKVNSLNNTTYTATIWWTGTGATNEWILGDDGMKIDWETSQVQDKNSTILPSKLTLNLLIEDLTQENFVENMRTNLQEKDVWIIVRFGLTGDVLWSGYFILDLEAKEDVSFPYQTTLVAIDGLATLKEVPFLRDTNSETGAVPSFPFVKADTYANAGYRRLIANSNSWIAVLLEKTGMLLATDSTTGTIENFVIQTAINWWNEDMNIGPQLQYCPWSQMKINMKDFYTTGSNNTYQPPSVYTVLVSICKNFNCRLFFWRNTFHFVQISEFNTDEQGTSPYTNPINIPTREHYYHTTPRIQRNYFGRINYSAYYQKIESATSNTGLQKLAGSIYQAIPAIKRTNTIYAESAGDNYFNGFPLFLTHNTVAGLDTTWPTDNASHAITQFSNANGAYNTMTLTDADELAGFICRIYCDFTNTSDTELKFQNLWTLRAKPATSSWGAADNYTAYMYTGAGSFTQIRWMLNEFPLLNNQQYIRKNIYIPANAVNQTMTIFDSSTDSLTNSTNNLFPTDPAFIGDWDFQFYTFTEYDNDRTYPMRAHIQGNSVYSHGRVPNRTAYAGGTTGSGVSPITPEEVPTYYGVDYVDSVDNNNDFMSMFVPVLNNAGAFGVAGEQIITDQSGNDTYTYNVGTIRFGDGSGANSTSTIQVWDGSNWVFVNPQGKWAKGIYVWNATTSEYDWSSLTYDKKIQELIGEEILNNQSSSIVTFNGTTVLSETDKYWPSSTRLKMVTPCAKLCDADGKEYMMMRGTFNFSNDEFGGEWVQVFYATPTTTTGSVAWDGNKFGPNLANWDNPGETP